MRLQIKKTEVRAIQAFTLIEVMIATAIFFMCMFGVLAVMSQGLKAAMLLKRDAPTAGMVASEYFASSSTNRVEPGTDSGDFGEFYKGYSWQRQVDVVSNGLFQVTITISRDGDISSILSTYLYDPKSAGVGSFQSNRR